MMTLEYLRKFMQTWNVWNLDNGAKAKPGIVNMLTILHRLITLLTIVMILMMIVIIIKQSPLVYNKDDIGGRSLCDYSACSTVSSCVVRVDMRQGGSFEISFSKNQNNLSILRKIFCRVNLIKPGTPPSPPPDGKSFCQTKFSRYWGYINYQNFCPSIF